MIINIDYKDIFKFPDVFDMYEQSKDRICSLIRAARGEEARDEYIRLLYHRHTIRQATAVSLNAPYIFVCLGRDKVDLGVEEEGGYFCNGC